MNYKEVNKNLFEENSNRLNPLKRNIGSTDTGRASSNFLPGYVFNELSYIKLSEGGDRFNPRVSPGDRLRFRGDGGKVPLPRHTGRLPKGIRGRRHDGV